MLTFEVDLRGLKKSLKGVKAKQLPFAIAQALTMTAGQVGEAWQDELRRKLDRPTPFTVNSVAVIPARKSRRIATVFFKDIAAEYLEPLIVGGPHSLGKKQGLLSPKNLPLNQYGNIPKSKLATLKGKPNVFVGPVTLKSGQVVNGVWQRNDVLRGKRRRGGYGTKGAHHVKHNEAMGLTGYNNRTTLKLLIRFTDPLPAKPVLQLQARAEAEVRKHFDANFAKAFNHAMATAK